MREECSLVKEQGFEVVLDPGEGISLLGRGPGLGEGGSYSSGKGPKPWERVESGRGTGVLGVLGRRPEPWRWVGCR